MDSPLLIHDSHYSLERRRRLRVVSITLPALIGLLLGLWTIGMSDEYFIMRLGIRKEFILAIVVSLLGVSGLSAVLTYLQTGFKSSIEAVFEELKPHHEYETARAGAQAEIAELALHLRSQVAEMRGELDRAKSLSTNIDDSSRKSLVADLKAQLTVETNASILDDLKTQVAASYSREIRDRELFARFDESRGRLATELEALGRRGNLNLALGAVTTVIGLIILGLSVYSELTAIKDLWSFVSHFVPRLTLVVLIELFAYFFLSLYKTSLFEIKYFQNELTNIESKQLALRTAISYGEPSLVADIAGKLAATERNHILSKDQTTVELEKARLEKDTKGEIAKYLADMFQKKA